MEDLRKNPRIGRLILDNLVLNNEAKLDQEGNILGGNITDKALLTFAKSYQTDTPIIEQKYFDSATKYASVTIDDNGTTRELLKGAPEVLMPKIREAYSIKGQKEFVDKEKLQNTISKYTRLGHRVLILAERASKYSNSLVFISLILLKDEISDTAKKAISLIENAHVHIVMITGDALETSKNIGREIGLLKSEDDLVLTSKDLSTMSD